MFNLFLSKTHVDIFYAKKKKKKKKKKKSANPAWIDKIVKKKYQILNTNLKFVLYISVFFPSYLIDPKWTNSFQLYRSIVPRE